MGKSLGNVHQGEWALPPLSSSYRKRHLGDYQVQLHILWGRELVTREIIGHFPYHILFTSISQCFKMYLITFCSFFTAVDIPWKTSPSQLHQWPLCCINSMDSSQFLFYLLSLHYFISILCVLKYLFYLSYHTVVIHFQSFWLIPINHTHLPLENKCLLRFEGHPPDILQFKRRFSIKLKEDSRSECIIYILVRLVEN